MPIALSNRPLVFRLTPSWLYPPAKRPFCPASRKCPSPSFTSAMPSPNSPQPFLHSAAHLLQQQGVQRKALPVAIQHPQERRTDKTVARIAPFLYRESGDLHG